MCNRNNTLRVYAKEFRDIPKIDIQKRILPNKNINDGKIETTMRLEPEILKELEKMKGENDWNDLMKKLIKVHEEKLDSEKPEPVEAASRHIPAKIEKFVAKRSAETCEFPGCTKKAEILHHTDRFAISQTHDPDKIRALCHEHHDIAHQGLIENEEEIPNRWQIKKYAYENNKFYEFTPKCQIDNVVMKKQSFT